MSINRNARSREARRVLAEIREMERHLKAVDDAELEDWSSELTNDERDAVTEGTDMEADEIAANQNARSNANWPMTASEKRDIAASLLRIAKRLN